MVEMCKCCGFSESEIYYYKEIFLKYDLKKSGVLDLVAVLQVLLDLGMPVDCSSKVN